jgi:hypothetical protein
MYPAVAQLAVVQADLLRPFTGQFLNGTYRFALLSVSWIFFSSMRAVTPVFWW